MIDRDYTLIYYGLPILGFIITALAQLFIKVTYSKYKKENISSQKKGYQVAREILDRNDLKNIKVEEVSGNLTDHYDPTKKVVRLSSDIYSGDSIASVSVAAHECGHAIQDKVGYIPMKIRSTLVPIVNFSTTIGYLVVTIGIIFGALKLTIIGIILLLSMLLFQLVTLPVEFNASKRGKKELAKLKILNSSEQRGSKVMLLSAAFTYVASVLTTFLQILRLVLIANSRRSRR